MKFLFRWAFRLFILLLVLVVAGILLLDSIVKAVAEYRIERQTGLDVKIGKMEVGILNPKVTIENFIIYNSAEFGGSPLINMPELHVEYDRNALLSNKLHCKLVRLNLAQVNVVENKNGKTNLELLQKRIEQTAPPISTNQNSRAGMQFTGIDTLNLTLGKATFLRMKQPDKVDEIKMEIHNQVLTNVHSTHDLAGVLLFIALKNGGTADKALQNWLGESFAPLK